MHNPIPRFCRSLVSLAAIAALTLSPAYALDQQELLSPFDPDLPSIWVDRIIQLLSPYQALENSSLELEERYRAWAEANPQLSQQQVVLEVNIGLDKEFYENTDLVSQPESLTALVNKYHALPRDYVPELEALGYPYGTGSLRPEAAEAFRAMADAAREDGIWLQSVSAYRSYERQESIYARYLSQDTQASVDSYSARPGYSEHQTALALDINTASLSAHFENTPAYAWLTEHCAEYGFILRYPQGKEDITGYRFEPWHYRYVGVEAAQACMSQDLTFEEYLALQPTDKTPSSTGPVEGLPFI